MIKTNITKIGGFMCGSCGDHNHEEKKDGGGCGHGGGCTCGEASKTSESSEE